MAIQQMLDGAAQKQRDEMAKLLGKPASGTTAGEAKKSMKIKKIGQCCMIIETKGVRIMTDPGAYSTGQDEEKNIDILVISHEHGDHFHVPSVKRVLENNPEAIVVTNTAVGKLLDAEGIAYQILEHGNNAIIKDVMLEAHGEIHAPIYKEMGRVQNTGYFFDDTLFYPGDAFVNPEKNVPILALPVAGPWLKMSEVIEYALLLKPQRAFPVHDAILSHPGMMAGMLGTVLQQEGGIEYVPLNAGEEHDFS